MSPQVFVLFANLVPVMPSLLLLYIVTEVAQDCFAHGVLVQSKPSLNLKQCVGLD